MTINHSGKHIVIYFYLLALFCLIVGCNSVLSENLLYPGNGLTKQQGHTTEVGVFYFPGWHSQTGNWKYIKGLPDWSDREPLLGYYKEEDIKIAEQHIEWANKYGVTFFAFDWYWNGKSTFLNHSVDNYLNASNNSKLKFSLLWANHFEVPKNLKEFDDMVEFWVKHYFMHPQYYRINEKPVVFIFSNARLDANAKKFGWTTNELLKRADQQSKNMGLAGVFFVATNDTRPSDKLETKLTEQGFSAYTGWCNYGAQPKLVADYQEMVDAYLDFYLAASKTKGSLLYIPPVSPGRDTRPWLGKAARVRSDATPQKFRSMLLGVKALIDTNKKGVMPLVMVQSWNEFAEGAYIEPTKKWGFEYLTAIQDVLGK